MSIVKFTFALAFAAAASGAFATDPVMPQPQPQPRRPFMRCAELAAPSGRTLEIYQTELGMTAHLSGRPAPIGGVFKPEVPVYQFHDGIFGEASYANFEIKRVNTHLVGVLLEAFPEGGFSLKDSYFKCAIIYGGSASSNGR